MRKASAITISIFIMMIVLAVLLGFTAFYVDQVMIRPVVMMKDTETSLRCFFVLSNIIGTDYIRDGETVPSNSMRVDLLKTYGLKNVQEEVELTTYEESFKQSLELMYGNTSLQIRNEEVFWTTVAGADTKEKNIPALPVACYMNVYGPIRIGTAGLFTQAAIEAAGDDTITELMNIWQEKLYPMEE